MTAFGVRRLGLLVLGLALALGPLVQASAAMQPSMEMSTQAGAEMPMPEGCDLCGDDGTMDAGACFAGCAALGAVLPPQPLIAGEGGQTVAELDQPAATDRRRPPDPQPPKFASTS